MLGVSGTYTSDATTRRISLIVYIVQRLGMPDENECWWHPEGGVEGDGYKRQRTKSILATRVLINMQATSEGRYMDW